MSPKSEHKTIRVALLGNPNSGKSSLFNALTGMQQKTGNYSGVTVERLEGLCNLETVDKRYRIHVVDLPGLYSLFPKSADEQVAVRTVFDPKEQFDVLVIVADASNLRRNLLLATQVLDLQMPAVLVLNMIDEAREQGIQIDINGLSETLGVEALPVDSRRGEGIEDLKQAIIRAKPGKALFYDLKQPQLQGRSYREVMAQMSLKQADNELQVFEESDKLQRYRQAAYLLSRFLKSPQELKARARSAKLDRLFTHRFFGYTILLLLLFLVFQLVFYVSDPPMRAIEMAFLNLGTFLDSTLPAGILSELLVNGVLPGLSGVLMFIPQIAFLFFMIGILEDSGYMARAGFIMDRVMRPFGLNGRSVIPLISGTACAVPSIMATRAISNSKERLITIFILPLISCSARLPVYTLLISVLYPAGSLWGIVNTQGLALLALYLLGFLASFLTAYALKKLVKSRESSHFIMELPVYRPPQLRNLLLLVYNKVKVFVSEAGKIILAISIILWFLSAFGYSDKFSALKAEEKVLLHQADEASQLRLKAVQTEKLQESYIGKLGQGIEPLIAPLGFDWKIGVALLTSFAAREVFVGTMATMYQSSDSQGESIRQKLERETRPDGSKKYDEATCWSLLLFYAFALQCMSTVAIVKRETKSWYWVSIQFLFMTALAYGASFLAFRLLS